MYSFNVKAILRNDKYAVIKIKDLVMLKIHS